MKKLKLFQHVRVCDRFQKQKDQMQITVAKYYLVEVVNPLTPISDEDRISPKKYQYDIKQISGENKEIY